MQNQKPCLPIIRESYEALDEICMSVGTTIQENRREIDESNLKDLWNPINLDKLRKTHADKRRNQNAG